MHDGGANAGPLGPEIVEAEDNTRFHQTFHVLWESYKKKRGRTLDPEQVQILVNAFAEISENANEAERVIKLQDDMIDQLQAKVEELETKKGRLWTPKK